MKADVQGSVQALEDSLLKLPQDEVRVNIVRAGAGGITENDVTLAMASDAIIVGFNVRPAARARARREGGRRHPDLPGDLRRDRRHQVGVVRLAEAGGARADLGEAEVRADLPGAEARGDRWQLRPIGAIKRNARARLVRDGVVVYDGRIASLRRFKDDVGEVRDGYECGIGLENYQDLKDGDLVEAYEVEEVARSI